MLLRYSKETRGSAEGVGVNGTQSRATRATFWEKTKKVESAGEQSGGGGDDEEEEDEFQLLYKGAVDLGAAEKVPFHGASHHRRSFKKCSLGGEVGRDDRVRVQVRAGRQAA